jgi:autotransporter-associated beta strand protein
MKPSETTLCRFALIGLTLVTALVPSSFAADITWADSAGNTTWTSNSTINSAPASASWVGEVAPMNNIATDTAIFTSVSNAQPVLTVQTRIAGVDFQMAGGGLAMDGGGGLGSLFQTGAGGIDSSLQTSGTNTITNARILTNGAANTWNLFSATDTASTSTFTFDSVVELGQNLTVIGQRNSAAGNVGIINFERAITGGNSTRSLTINSSNTNNTVNLKGVNTYLGVTNVNTGIVNVQNDQSAATGGWSIVTSANSTATLAATVNFSTGSTVVVDTAKKIQLGTTANSGAFAASTLNVAGSVTNNGTLQLERAGVLNLNSGAIWIQSGNLTVSGRGGASSTLNVNAGSDMTYSGSSTVKLNSAGASGGTGGLNIDGTGRFTTSAGFENLNTLTTGSGVSRVRLTDGGTLRLSADVANLTTQTRFDLSAGGGVIDTNGFSTTLSGVTTAGSTSTTTGITGNGTLTKTGNGTLTLSGVNTYTGNTTVNGGTLAVSSADFADASTVLVASGAILTLNFTGTDTIAALFINGVQKSAGLYDSSNSSGAINGTGSLTVTSGPVASDTTPPVIDPAAPVAVSWGSSYTDVPPSATDDIDPSVTVISSGTVNTAKPGIYTLTYNASDAANNAATPVIRTVTVSIANPTTVGADGLSPLLRYALGANSPSETVQAPVLNSTATTLSLTAVVRTDDTALTVGAEAVDNLTGTWGTGGTVTTTNAADQSGVPSGSARKVFTVDTTGASRKFLRLTATLTP